MQASVREVDLRSDTVTRPTAAMRAAMAAAAVGDDVYGEDPTVNALQDRVAALLGKEAALFVPSGTMGNLASVMAHCWTRGCEVIIGDQTHIFMYEQGGISQLGGVFASVVPNLEDGRFEPGLLEGRIRPREPESHEPSTALVCLENTNNRCGGRVQTVDYVAEVCALAHRHGVSVHMDGARLLNAAEALGVPPADIVRDCDSVSMCLSKGIGAPVGSVVAGSREFIDRVHRMRKVLGGAMRQAGVLAAAALVALDSAQTRIHADHQRTKKLAQDIHDLNSKLVTADPGKVQSNMILLLFPSEQLDSEEFVKKMAEVNEGDREKIVVKASTWYGNRVRCVLHSDLTDEDIGYAFEKIKSIAL